MPVTPPRLPGTKSFKATPPPAPPPSQVEVGKIDPKEIFDAQALARGGEEGLLDRAQPIDYQANREKAAARLKAEQEKKVPQAPPIEFAEDPKDVIDTVVTDDLISRLEKEYGLSASKYTEAELPFQGKTMKVTLRAPDYDDWLWMMAFMERKIASGEDQALMSSEGVRKEIAESVIACRCLVRIDGAWLWDLFKVREQIQHVVPDWDGETYEAIPDFMRGALAQTAHQFFRKKLHPDVLFALAQAVKGLDKSGPDEEEAEAENPTGGA